ncbi:LapA family protein [Corynebacterium lubricantis]|uniref:LapA family protein n=1 Tax=Corynebacterium lubricantis TaxID=541095 RepID=UPI000380FD24|nr:lipopolysaccharide assembly protein LapA domain-containing protein [Corynebacterium lubricantis]
MTRDSSSAGSYDYSDPIEPVDPTDIPEPTDTAQPPAVREEPMPHAEDTKPPAKVSGSLAAGTWAALIVGTLLLILLIIFILQNQQEVEITLFQWTWHFPAAIAYLMSAITGALIMALVGGWRMFELRRQVKKAYKS